MTHLTIRQLQGLSKEKKSPLELAGCLKNTQKRPVTPAALKPLKWTVTTRKSAKSTGTATKGIID